MESDVHFLPDSSNCFWINEIHDGLLFMKKKEKEIMTV